MNDTNTENTTAGAKNAAPVEAPKVFAIVRSGGKQYRVTTGSKVYVDLLELEPGASVTFDDVLMAGTEGGVDVKVGTEAAPLAVKVTGKVVAQTKEKKVIIFKKRRRGGYTKKQGHRQKKTEVVVESIAL